MHSEFSEFYGLDSVSRLSDFVGDGRLFIQIVPLKQSRTGQTKVAVIFHALCLCRKLDPRRIHFQYQRLRRLLLESLENESFDNVSISSSPGPIPKALFEINVRLYCHCDMPYTKEPMTKCCVCDSWFHHRCETGHLKKRIGNAVIEAKTKSRLKANERDKKCIYKLYIAV